MLSTPRNRFIGNDIDTIITLTPTSRHNQTRCHVHYAISISQSTETPHYSDVIMSTMASQVTSLTIVYSTFYSGADQRKYQSSVSLAFVRGIHRWPVNSAHKGSVTRKMLPYDDVIMILVRPLKRRPVSLMDRRFVKRTAGSWISMLRGLPHSVENFKTF